MFVAFLAEQLTPPDGLALPLIFAAKAGRDELGINFSAEEIQIFD